MPSDKPTDLNQWAIDDSSSCNRQPSVEKSREEPPIYSSSPNPSGLLLIHRQESAHMASMPSSATQPSSCFRDKQGWRKPRSNRGMEARLLCVCWVCINDANVTRTARSQFIGEVASACRGVRLHHVENRVSRPRAQVVPTSRGFLSSNKFNIFGLNKLARVTR